MSQPAMASFTSKPCSFAKPKISQPASTRELRLSRFLTSLSSWSHQCTSRLVGNSKSLHRQSTWLQASSVTHFFIFFLFWGTTFMILGQWIKLASQIIQGTKLMQFFILLASFGQCNFQALGLAWGHRGVIASSKQLPTVATQQTLPPSSKQATLGPLLCLSDLSSWPVCL